jgi:hypothetical protein
MSSKRLHDPPISAPIPAPPRRTDRLKRIAIAGVCGLLACAPAFAQDHSFGDWRAFVDTVDTVDTDDIDDTDDTGDTDEDLRTTCRIATGGDGMPVLSLTISNGDVGPPDAYPGVMFSETVPRGHDTGMKNGVTVSFTTCSGQIFSGVASRWINDGGSAQAEVAIDYAQTQWAIKAMQEGGSFEGPYGDISLQGFAKAYAAMLAGCGFAAAYEGHEVAHAPTKFFQYRGWHVVIEDASNTEHDLSVCAAYTGMDGTTGIVVATGMRDEEAPMDLPAIIVGETPAPEASGPVVQDATVYVSFDDGRGIGIAGSAWINENGVPQAAALLRRRAADAAAAGHAQGA